MLFITIYLNLIPDERFQNTWEVFWSLELAPYIDYYVVFRMSISTVNFILVCTIIQYETYRQSSSSDYLQVLYNF